MISRNRFTVSARRRAGLELPRHEIEENTESAGGERQHDERPGRDAARLAVIEHPDDAEHTDDDEIGQHLHPRIVFEMLKEDAEIPGLHQREHAERPEGENDGEEGDKTK